MRRVEKRNYRMDETQCLRMIRASLAPSTGCTEPAAIALNAATARKAAQGTVTQVTARLDAYLFKNAMGVGIETATLFTTGFANHIPTGALLLVSDQPMIPEGVKTEQSDSMVTKNFVHEHVEIGIDALRMIIDEKKTVKHLKFDW